jgi:methylthioribose-1-phosphate isomerase
MEKRFELFKERLAASRPTAGNLFWALDRMTQHCAVASAQIRNEEQDEDKAVAMLLEELKNEALLIQTEDARMCQAIGEFGLELLQPGMGILTHCNAGALATSELGTALAPLYLGNERGYRFKVFADETRPLLQGARLTAWELSMAKIDVTVICDNMAASVLKNGHVQAVLVGCDRIAANGDMANKIGTSGVAILARYYNVPFYVLGPTSSIDWACGSGSKIEIEVRDPEEISTLWYAGRMVPEGVSAWNPAFDVTDASLISAIVTEKGIAYPPYARTLGAFR